MHINGIVKSQCLGCMMNRMDHHDICQDSGRFVPLYFNDAMMILDDEEMREVLREKVPGVLYLPKALHQANNEWCERMKEAIIDLF
jgi:hypothetical protein